MDGVEFENTETKDPDAVMEEVGENRKRLANEQKNGTTLAILPASGSTLAVIPQVMPASPSSVQDPKRSHITTDKNGVKKGTTMEKQVDA